MQKKGVTVTMWKADGGRDLDSRDAIKTALMMFVNLEVIQLVTHKLLGCRLLMW